MNRLNGYLDSYVGQAGFLQHGGIFSGISLGNMIHQSSGTIRISGAQQVAFTAFGDRAGIKFDASGYYSGWAVKSADLQPMPQGPNANAVFDVYHPILGSGVSLQHVWRGNRNEIEITTPYGSLVTISDTAKVRFEPGSRAALNLSGILFAPVNTGSTNDPGDINSCLHSVLKPQPRFLGAILYTDPTTNAEMRARALGVGTLFFNTGSGIANLSIGSGINGLHLQTYLGSTTFPMNDNKEVWTRLPIGTPVFDDRHFTFQAGPTGITIQSAGLYRCSYSVTFERVAVNATPRELAVRAVLYQNVASVGGPVGGSAFGVASPVIPQSIAYAHNANTAIQRNHVKHTFMFNADGDDLFALEGVHVAISAASDGVRISSSGCVIILQKIGPKRGNFR